MPGSSEKKDPLGVNQVTREWKSLSHGYNSNGIWGLSLLHWLRKNKRRREVFEYRTFRMKAKKNTRTLLRMSVLWGLSLLHWLRLRKTTASVWVQNLQDEGQKNTRALLRMSVLLSREWRGMLCAYLYFWLMSLAPRNTQRTDKYLLRMTILLRNGSWRGRQRIRTAGLVVRLVAKKWVAEFSSAHVRTFGFPPYLHLATDPTAHVHTFGIRL